MLQFSQNDPQLKNLSAYEQECNDVCEKSQEHSRINKMISEIHNKVRLIE